MNSLVVVFLVAISTVSASYGNGATLIGASASGVVLPGPKAGLWGAGAHGAGIITAAAAPGYLAAAPALLAAPAGPAYVGLAHGGPTGTLIDGPSGQIRTNGNPNGLIAATAGYTAPALAPVAPAIVAAPALALGGYGYGGYKAYGGHY